MAGPKKLKLDKVPDSWNRETLTSEQVREMAERSENTFNQTRSKNSGYQSPFSPKAVQQESATNKPFSWFNDPGHISDVVDSTTGQVISVDRPSRISGIFSGAAKSTGSDFLNAAGTAVNAIQNPDYNRRQIQRLEKTLETGWTTDGKKINDTQRATIQDAISRMQREIQQWEAQNSTANRLYSTADRLQESAEQDIAQAKEGLGGVGRFLVDTGVAGTQLAGDVLVGALLAPVTGGVSAIAPMAVRGFGSGAQQARQEGASLGQQLAYGAGSAALGVATEKISNVAAPFRKIFGSGVADDLAGKLVSRFGENTAVQTMNRLSQTAAGRLAASALGEGSEEFIEDVFQPVLQRATYDPDAQFDLSGALYDAAVGAALGGVGGAVDIAQRRSTDAAGTAQTEAAPVSTPQAQEAAQGVSGAGTAAVNENGLTALTPQERENLSSGTKNKVISTFQGAVDFVKNALSNRQSVDRAYLGKIPEQVAQMIRENTGIRVSNYGVMLNGNDVRHIIREHGDPIVETARGQSAVTADDIARIPEILSAPDRVYLSDETDGKGRRALVFEKQIGDQNVTIQGISDGKRVLQTDTLYKQRRTRTTRDTMPGADTSTVPVINAQGEPPQSSSDSMIAPGTENVNSDVLAQILFGDAQQEATGTQTPPTYDNLGSARQGFTSTQNDGGTIPINQQVQVTTQSVQGREPTDVPRVNPRTGQEISRTVSTILNSPITSNEFAAEINAAIPDGTFDNITISDRTAVANSQAKIDQEGYRAVADRFLTKNDLNQRLSKWDMADAIMAYNAANEIGDKVTAYNLAVAISENAHDSAQIVQAVNLMNRLTPEGKLIALRRFVNKLNLDRAPSARTNRNRANQDEGRYQYVEQNAGYTISDELATTYLMAETEAERSAAWDAIMTDIANQIPGTFIDKANFVRYTSMLLNPTTHTRNLAGNAIQWGARKIKNAIGTVLERAVIRDPRARTKSFLNPVSRGDRALKQFARDQYAEDQAAAMGVGKYVGGSSSGIAQEIRARQRAFRGNNILSRGIQALGDLNSKVLDAEDLLFNRPAYVGALARALKAQGVTAQEAASGQKADQVAQARAYAIQEAQRATYRNTTEFSEAVSRAGSYRGENRLLRAASFAVNAEFPFRRTPANILTTALDYSPAGLAVGIKNALWDVHRGNMTAADAIDHISAGLTGTGILALGAFLASQGLLTLSPGEDDREQEYLENMGYQGYALQIGDHSYTLDWAVPAAMPLFAGAAIMESIQNDGGTFEEVMDALTQVSGVLLEMSMMSSLDDFMEYYAYAENKPLYVLDSIASDYLGQFVPTLGGRIASVLDDTVRSSYSESGAGQLESDADYFLQSILRKIPGAREQMQPSIDLWGNEVSNGSLPERILESFVSPGYYSGTGSSALDQELMRLAQATGNTEVYPSQVSKSISVGGKEKTLTADEYTTYARTVGSTRFDIASALIESDAYQQAPNDLKAEMLEDAYDYANAIGKQAVSDYELDGWIKKAEESRVSPADYIIFMATSDRDGSGRTDQVEAGQTLLEIMGISDKQRSSVWRAQDSSWNMDKDPFGGKLLGYGIPPETSLQIMAKYKEIDDTVYAGKSVPRQKQTDFERYLDTLGLNESQLAAVNDLYKFWSMYPAKSYN